ncbi:MAG: ComEA family DNA-binding protein [Phycisphaerae bacterium]
MTGAPRDQADPTSCAMVLLALMMTPPAVRVACHASGDSPVPETIRTIDPNTAPWWELAALPDIGPTIAHRMVSYRKAAASARDGGVPVFVTPSDLARVRGIGPKTVERIAPFLAFHPG